jgi:hypothetical protein
VLSIQIGTQLGLNDALLIAFAYSNAVSGQVLKYRGKLVYNVRNRSLQNCTGFLSPYLPSSLLIYLHAAVRWCS